jgi:carboxylesterase type B
VLCIDSGNAALHLCYVYDRLHRMFAGCEPDMDFFANFIKTGNPNGKGLPNWPKFAAGQRLIIDVNTRAEADNTRARYEFLDQFYIKE